MNANTSTSSQSRDLRGTWGGQSIAMEVTDAGATIEYDCAHGRITEKIAPDGGRKVRSQRDSQARARRTDSAWVKMTVSRPSIVVQSRMKR